MIQSNSEVLKRCAKENRDKAISLLQSLTENNNAGVLVELTSLLVDYLNNEGGLRGDERVQFYANGKVLGNKPYSN